MAEFTRRLFKVRKGEEGKVFLFVALSALLQAGLAVGMSAADSLFLVKLGAGHLPYVFLLMPVMMLVYTSIYSYLTSRFGIDRVFDLTLALVTVGGAAVCLLLQLSHPAVYYGVKLYAGLWYIGLYTLFWNFTDSYFDIQDAKRLFPLFTGGAATGAMAGGALVSLLSHRLPVENLFLIWAASALLGFPLVLVLRRKWARIETDEEGEQKGFIQEIRDTSAFMRRSQFVRLLMFVMFTALVLTTLIEFQYSTIFAQGRSAAQLAALLGALYAFVNGFNLIVNFFLFNRLVLAFGVGNFVLITPLVYLATFLYLLFGQGFSAAVLGFFAYQGILTSIEWNNTNFLFNAVPSEARKQVRTVAEGLCEPLATAAAGLFLLLFGTRLGYVWITRKPSAGEIALLSPEGISTIGVLGAGLYLVLAIFLRSSYLRSMVTNLKREWLDLSRPAGSVLSGLDSEQIRTLVQQAKGEDRETARLALQTLWLNDREKAFSALLDVMSRGTEADVAMAQPLLAMMLEEEDPDRTRALLEWIDRQEGTVDPAFLYELGHHGLIASEEVAHLFGSADPEERAAAAVAARDSWRIAARLQALQTVDGLLRSDDAGKVAAVRALGRSGSERDAHALAALLLADLVDGQWLIVNGADSHQPLTINHQPSTRCLRGETLMALHRLVTRDSSRVLPVLLQAIAEGDSQERLLAIQTLAKIADTDCIVPLLVMSDRFTPYERRQAESVLCTIGLKSVPAAVAVLRDVRFPYPGRSIAARALGRLAPPQLEAVSAGLLQAELQRAYESLAYHQALEDTGLTAGSPGLQVLSRFYRDRQGVTVDFVLELLTLGGRLPAFELISAALRSGSRRERANAIETIEQGVNRPIFKLLLPMVDGRSVEERVDFYRRRLGGQESSHNEIVMRALHSPVSLECAAAAQTMWEEAEPRAAARLRDRLREAAPPLFRDTLLSLLTRRRREGQAVPNLIERLAYLSRSSFFEGLTLSELEVVAARASIARWEPGEPIFTPGDPADALFVVADGLARLEGSERSVRIVGDVIGEEALFGQALRGQEARSEGLSVLRIASSDLMSAARTYPRIAISLLAQQPGSAGVPPAGRSGRDARAPREATCHAR